VLIRFEAAHLQVRRHKSVVMVAASRLSSRRAVALQVSSNLIVSRPASSWNKDNVVLKGHGFSRAEKVLI
jgi:hypothetical protein